MAKWSHQVDKIRGIEEPYEVTNFFKGRLYMGLYETEDYINDLEELIKLLRIDADNLVLSDVERKRLNELQRRHRESIWARD